MDLDSGFDLVSQSLALRCQLLSPLMDTTLNTSEAGLQMLSDLSRVLSQVIEKALNSSSVGTGVGRKATQKAE